MYVKRSIATYVALGLHPIEQLLDRGVLGRLASWIKNVRQLADRRRLAIPEDSQDRELRIRDVLSGSTHQSCSLLVVLSELSVVLSEFKIGRRLESVKRALADVTSRLL